MLETPGYETQGRGKGQARLYGFTTQIEFWGRGQIKGTVTYANRPTDIPLARRVRLFEMRSGLLVGEMWSKMNGEYQIDRLDTRYEYFAVSDDHERAWEGIVVDYVSAKEVVYP
ncbi:MAG: hypothetical protein LBE75_06505 [Burkholderiales bacterium]|jgi:hypothetical protein|nr:hypothetical protein [Burkholderiales bacterium]